MNKVIILYEYIEGIAVVNICMCSSRAVSPGAARLETKYLGGRIMPPPPLTFMSVWDVVLLKVAMVRTRNSNTMSPVVLKSNTMSPVVLKSNTMSPVVLKSNTMSPLVLKSSSVGLCIVYQIYSLQIYYLCNDTNNL